MLLIAVFTLGLVLLETFIFKDLQWIFVYELGQFFLILLFEGVITGFLGMTFYYISIKKGNLSVGMPIAFISPFWGSLLAVMWLIEVLTIKCLFSMIVIITGIIFVTAYELQKLIRFKMTLLMF